MSTNYKAIKRGLVYSAAIDNNKGLIEGNDDGYPMVKDVSATDPEKGNLVISRLVDEQGNHITDGNALDLHAPVIDIDLPVALIPTARLGHYHLLIDKPMTADQYFQLLKTLSEVGIIEQGYYEASLIRGYSAIRRPGKCLKDVGQVPNLKEIQIQASDDAYKKYQYEVALREIVNSCAIDQSNLSTHTKEIIKGFNDPASWANLSEEDLEQERILQLLINNATEDQIETLDKLLNQLEVMSKDLGVYKVEAVLQAITSLLDLLNEMGAIIDIDDNANLIGLMTETAYMFLEERIVDNKSQVIIKLVPSNKSETKELVDVAV